jgi:hypothetical protein
MTELILTQRREYVFEVILNRPGKRNAINWPMMTELDGEVKVGLRTEQLPIMPCSPAYAGLLFGSGGGLSHSFGEH